MSSSSQKKVYQILLATFLIGALLRLYRLDDFAIFLGDQGRDAIVMKRIVMFEHFPAVGAPSSVGQVYLGPFFYYFMAPWLALYNFNPLGPVVGVALLSSLFILIVFYGVRDLFGERPAIITSALIAFSAVLVDLSRFSWNPNILPIFSFITFYLFAKALLTQERRLFILAGVFLGFAFQLHYVTFSLIFAFIAAFVFFTWQQKKNLLVSLKKIILMIISFIVINTPLILFDLRHNFLNTKNFITLFQKPGSTGSASLTALIDGFSSLNTFAFSINIPFVILICSIAAMLYSIKIWKDKEYQYLVIVFLTSLVVTAFMTANKFPHYFGALYPLYYVLIAVVVSRIAEKISKKNSTATALGLTLAIFVFIYLQFPRYSFLNTQPGRQIAHAERTAHKIYPLITKDLFRVTGIPDTAGTSMYSYYLEVWGKTPVNNLSLDPADEMFVVCEKQCKPIGNPQWDIAYYQPKEVETSFQSDHIFIYKLTK